MPNNLFKVQITEDRNATVIKVEFPDIYDRSEVENLMGSLDASEGMRASRATANLQSYVEIESKRIGLIESKHIGVIRYTGIIQPETKKILQENLKKLGLSGSFEDQITAYLIRKAGFIYPDREITRKALIEVGASENEELLRIADEPTPKDEPPQKKGSSYWLPKLKFW